MNHITTQLTKRIRAEQVTNLFEHTYTISLGHSISGILLASTFWSSVSSSWILSWLSLFLTISIVRIPAYIVFKRANTKLTESLKWRNILYSLCALQGVVYAIAFVFLAFQTPSHLHHFILIWMFAITGCSVVGFVSDLKGLMCFFLPSIIPGTISLVIASETAGTSLWFAFAILTYSTAIIKMIIPVHKSIINAMQVNYSLQNEVETRKVVEAKLHKLSIEDALTGAYNRRYFDTSLADAISCAKHSNSTLCLVLIDIDHFKLYNDFYGHQQGDNCLQTVVKVLQRGLRRDNDILARYGGEEFAIVLPNMASNDAITLVNNLRNELKKEALEHQKVETSAVTISAGITQLIHQAETSPEHLIKQADKALYDAKYAGRDCVRLFNH